MYYFLAEVLQENKETVGKNCPFWVKTTQVFMQTPELRSLVVIRRLKHCPIQKEETNAAAWRPKKREGEMRTKTKFASFFYFNKDFSTDNK